MMRERGLLTSGLSVLASLALAGALSSCSVKEYHPEDVSGVELAFTVDIRGCGTDTKGYVKDTTLYETATARSTERTPRELRVTAHLYPQDGEDYDYLTDETFALKDGRWCHDPALYWPLGASMDLLVRSTGHSSDSVLYAQYNRASRTRMYVSEDYLQDDILYGSLWSRTVESSLRVPMKHAQAWLTVSFCNISHRTVTVTSVTFEDIYTAGVLDVGNNYGDVTFDWDFRTARAADKLMDDGGSVYGVPVAADTLYLDMLVPEQLRTALTVTYVEDGVEKTERLALSHAYWLAGTAYEYQVTWADRITITPCVHEWSMEDIGVSI